MTPRLGDRKSAAAEPEDHQIRQGAQTSGVEAILGLQQTYGNAYVQRVLKLRAVQTKLTVHPPDDECETKSERRPEAIGSERTEMAITIPQPEPGAIQQAANREAGSMGGTAFPAAKPAVGAKLTHDQSLLWGAAIVHKISDAEELFGERPTNWRKVSTTVAQASIALSGFLGSTTVGPEITAKMRAIDNTLFKAQTGADAMSSQGDEVRFSVRSAMHLARELM